jgi:hypothetical protein
MKMQRAYAFEKRGDAKFASSAGTLYTKAQ